MGVTIFKISFLHYTSLSKVTLCCVIVVSYRSLLLFIEKKNPILVNFKIIKHYYQINCIS